MTNIGERVFYECQSLQAINVDKNNSKYLSDDGVLIDKKLGKLIRFPEAKVTADYTISDDIVAIDSYAFSDCQEIFGSVYIHDKITEIGDAAFLSCTNLAAINVDEENNDYVSLDGVLFNKDKTILIQYPAGKILPHQYHIPETVKRLESGSFFDVWNLKSVIIPDSVEEFGNSVFVDCVALENVCLSESLEILPYYAFSGCKSLTSLIIPDSVTKIGRGVMGRCESLQNVMLGAKLESVAEYLFQNALNLKHIYSLNPVPPHDEVKYSNCGIFGSKHWNPEYADPVPEDLTIYVPSETVENYEDSDTWYGWKDIKSLSASPGIILSSNQITLSVGENIQLSAKYFLDDSANTSFYWYSRKESIATVDESGCVVAQGPGKTSIYVETNIDGRFYRATCSVTVSELSNIESVYNTEIIVSNDVYSLQGALVKRNATVDDVNALRRGIYIVSGKKILVK